MLSDGNMDAKFKSQRMVNPSQESKRPHGENMAEPRFLVLFTYSSYISIYKLVVLDRFNSRNVLLQVAFFFLGLNLITVSPVLKE